MNTLTIIEADFSLIKITGADCERYLQGRVSQDVSKLTTGGSPLASLLLTPQGKLLGVMSISKTDSGYEILNLGGEAESFIESLLLFKVADDIEAEIITKEPIISIGEASSSEGQEFAWPSIKSEDNQPAIVFKVHKESSEELASASDYNNLRNYLGLPKFGVDVVLNQISSVIPLDNFVSFSKGCYAGQEVVEKSQAYGRVNKTLVSISSSSEFKAKDEVVSPEKKVGVLTSSSSEAKDGSFFGLALIDGKALEQELLVNGSAISIR